MTLDTKVLGNPMREGSVVSAGKILVVDDDPPTREVLRVIFERYSYEVDEADDDLQALARIQSFEPDLVTTDVAHPGGSGFHLLRLVKNHRPSLPVVFVTASDACRELCMAEGAAAFIGKPFEPKELVDAIRKVLSRDADD